MESLARVDCNFEAIVSDTLKNLLDEEFQYQMELTDGTYVLWYDTHFRGHQVEPANDGESQAVLQYFASCGCPFSMLRLGRLLAKRNYQHGPIVSDVLAIKYLVTGLEQLNNSLFDMNVNKGIILYTNSAEFLLVCTLIATYEKELERLGIWQEIKQIIGEFMKFGSKNGLNY